jgi:hypothetical protein
VRRPDGSDIPEVADHVNCVLVPDWGPWGTPSSRQAIADRIVADLTEARVCGIGKAIVCVGFLMFDAAHRAYLGTSELALFRARLTAAGLADMVIGLYVLDEPDLVPVPDAIMATAFRDARATWQTAKICVIYSDHGTPGIAEADWIGTDRYGLGSGVLAHLPGLRGAQRWLLVPGGADPWKNDPGPFCDFALAHPEVAGIVAFLWGDYGEGKGIRANGMAEAYRAAGRRIIGGNA